MHQLQGYRLDKHSSDTGVKIVYAKKRADRGPPTGAPRVATAPAAPRAPERSHEERCVLAPTPRTSHIDIDIAHRHRARVHPLCCALFLLPGMRSDLTSEGITRVRTRAAWTLTRADPPTATRARTTTTTSVATAATGASTATTIRTTMKIRCRAAPCTACVLPRRSGLSSHVISVDATVLLPR
eukprot:6554043-Prymnesium_polylepis.2